MELKTITKDEYKQILKDFFPDHNFLQSSFEGEKMKLDQWDIYYFAGLQDNKVMVCALIRLRPLMKVFTYAYIPRGPLFSEENLEPEFYSHLKKWLKKRIVFI